MEAFARGALPHAPEHVVLPALGSQMRQLFECSADAERRGIYVVSANAGFQSSRNFWAQAQQTGVGFANPELFPWTLSNAPCGWLARRFEVRGPNVTYAGNVDALLSALNQADDHLATRQIDAAWIVAVDFSQTARQKTRFAAVRLSASSSMPRLDESTVDRTAPANRLSSAALWRAIDTCRDGSPANHESDSRESGADGALLRGGR